MKRLLTSAVMFLCCMEITFAQFSGSGSGTESDPYLILNPIQLNQLRNFLNQSGVYFKLMADIDLTSFLEDENPNQGWQPVGSSSSAAFKGFLDGNGKTIKGLCIKRNSENNVGFFGYTDGATIKNIVIEASTIEGLVNVAGISGYSKSSTFSDCSFSGSVKGESHIGGFVGNCGDNMVLSGNIAKVRVIGTGNSIGGFIGRNDAGNNLTISKCYLYDGIIKGVNNVGGCCGENVNNHSNSNSISNIYIHANITGSDYVGGICGISNNYYRTINLNSCGFCGEIVGASFVGGLVGKINKFYNLRNKEDKVQNCFFIGCISATGDYVGGLIGYDYGSDYADYGGTIYYGIYGGTNISNNYHSGPILGSNFVGGLVGYKKYGEISNCYTIGSVSGVRYVGGLLGYQESKTTLKKSITNNTRVTATMGNVNRVVGYNEGTIGAMGSTDENKAFNRTIIISQGVAQDITDNLLNGTGVSTTTLKLKATYVAMGWDFNDTWEIQETECYPYMKSQTAPPVIQSQVVSGATTVSGKCVDGGTITLEIDGVKQQMVSTGHEFSFTVSPLQAGHEVRVSAKAEGKEQSYFTTEVVSFIGKGTEADPYQISTAADLTQVYRKGYYKLMNDVDLTDYINQFSPAEGWQSIGRDGSETIHFDGDGHKITGLWCNSTRDNTGLFSCFANGTIKNLTVEIANGKQVKGGSNTGILIGKMMNGTIENCQVKGEVVDGTPVGGLVGLFIGGTISKCLADVNISTTLATSYVGGLVGEITEGTIDQCITTGTLTAYSTESYIGGMVGKNSATVTNCHSSAIVTSSYNAAGLVAYNYGVVDMCYATGNLYSNNYAAGIIGYNDGANAVVSNCVAMNNKIEIVYESQQIQQGGGYGQRIIGGIKNNAPAPEMNNYALKTMQVSVNDVPQKVYDDIMNGVGKIESILTECSTYQGLGWDFSNVWDIDEGNEYPKLKWESMINPSAITRGDANGDEEVNVTDYMAIANYILGSNPINFNENTADVNTDGIVNVIDYVGVANIILYGNYQGKSLNTMKAKKTDFSNTTMDIEQAEDGLVNLLVHGVNTFSAFQMDIVLSEGMEISDTKMAKSSLTRNLGFARLPNGTWRLLYGTLENSPVSLVEDHLLTIELRTDKQNVGSNISIENILLTKDNTSTIQLNNASTNVITGINQMENGEWKMENATIHDLSGRRISVSSVLPKGVYIINGKKIIK